MIDGTDASKQWHNVNNIDGLKTVPILFTACVGDIQTDWFHALQIAASSEKPQKITLTKMTANVISNLKIGK